MSIEAPPANARSIALAPDELAHLAAAGMPSSEAATLYSLGQWHYRSGRIARAIECFDAAIASAPANADYLNERAIAAIAMKDFERAARLFRDAIRCTPDNAQLHCNLANALRDAGRPGEALAPAERARELQPASTGPVIAHADLLEALGRPQDALAAYEYAHRLAPGDMQAQLGMGRMLTSLERHAEAEQIFERAVRQAPSEIQALFGVAMSRGHQFRFADALDVYRRAVALAPHLHALHNNIGFMLTCLGRYDEADSAFRETLRLKPGLPIAEKMLGMSALRRGRYREGWRLYEARKSGGVAHGYFDYDMPEWRGEPLDGKRILLAREQGAGDELQFVRYANALHRLGATVDVWTRPELLALMSRAAGVHRALAERPHAGYDFFAPMMSVPLHLPDDTVLADTPYLSPDPQRVAEWRSRLAAAAGAGARRKIGLVWAGNPAHHLDRFRSMPLQTLAPLARIEGLAWFALQKGAAESEIAPLAPLASFAPLAPLAPCADDAPGWPIHALGPQLQTFDDTAAAIQSLDVVVTVDTSVAHLAGALGRRVWVMLPAQSDWRWHANGDRCAWYPSARLFRQTTLGDWTPVVESLGDALRALVSERR